MDGAVAKNNLTEEQRKYCIHQCKYGKQKVQELLHTCDSIFDMVEDMQIFTEICHEKNNCPFDNLKKETC